MIHHYLVTLNVGDKQIHSEVIELLDTDGVIVNSVAQDKIIHGLHSLTLNTLYARDSMSASSPVAVFRRQAIAGYKPIVFTVVQMTDNNDRCYQVEKTLKNATIGYLFNRKLRTDKFCNLFFDTEKEF